MVRSRRVRRAQQDRARARSDDELARLIDGWRRTEHRQGHEWTVQPVSGPRAVKTYTCPGCHGAVHPGTAHVVVWRADGVLGDRADLDARRHWHEHCWRVA